MKCILIFYFVIGDFLYISKHNLLVKYNSEHVLKLSYHFSYRNKLFSQVCTESSGVIIRKFCIEILQNI